MRSYILRKLQITENEITRVRYLWWLRFLYKIAFIWVWTIMFTIVLDTFGIAYIPLYLIADAVLWLLGSLCFGFLFIRIGVDRFMLLMLSGVFFSMALALWKIDSMIWYLGGLAIAKGFFLMPLGIALYRKNESWLSPSEAQRIMPVIDTAVPIGLLAGSLLILGLLDVASVKQLLSYWIIPLVAMSFLVVFQDSLVDKVPHFKQKKPLNTHRSSLYESISAVRRIPFFRYLLYGILIQAVVFTMVEIQFLSKVSTAKLKHKTEHFISQQDPNTTPVENSDQVTKTPLLQASLFTFVQESGQKAQAKVANGWNDFVTISKLRETVAHKLSVISVLVALCALFIQGILTSRIYQKIGVVRSMISFFLGFFPFLLCFALWPPAIYLLRGYQHSAHSMFDVGYHMTFYSLFSHRRESVRHFFEGIIKPLGIILGAMIWLGLSYTAWTLSVPIVISIFLVLLMGGLWCTRDLFTSLTHKNLHASEDVMIKLHAIEVLGQKGHAKAVEMLGVQVIDQKLPEIVRLKALETLGEIGCPSVLHFILQLLEDRDYGELHMKALEITLHLDELDRYWTQHAFSHHQFIQVMTDLLEGGSSAHIQKLALMNLLRHQPPTEMVQLFVKMLNSQDTHKASVCLRSARELFRDPALKPFLTSFVEHEHPQLRGHAAIALWDLDSSDKIKNIIFDLLQSSDRQAQIAGIYAAGEIGDPCFKGKIIRFLAYEDALIHRHCLVALAKLGDASFVPGMIQVLTEAETTEAQKILSMLKRIPRDLYEKLFHELYLSVSRQLQEILEQHHYCIEKANKASLKKLEALYQLVGRYDDMILVQKWSKG